MRTSWGWVALTVLAAPHAAQGGEPATAPAPARTETLTVADAAVARTVVDRAPQDTGSAFPPDVGELTCFTKITGATGGDSVHHVWFHGDTQVADVTLAVNGTSWRTWSTKTVPADWTGPWHVEIQDASGKVLRRLDFTVGP